MIVVCVRIMRDVNVAIGVEWSECALRLKCALQMNREHINTHQKQPNLIVHDGETLENFWCAYMFVFALNFD